MSGSIKRPVTSGPSGPLRGMIRPIGDKSLTHRALILAGLARGPSRITHPNPGEDCACTARAMAMLGAGMRAGPTGWDVEGGAGRLRDPSEILDLGNSGTGIRLLCGVIAGQGLFAVLTGDPSLRARPMRRIAGPLVAMGATVLLRENEYPPIAVRGGALRAIHHQLPVASAQVKSCLLLAGLGLSAGELSIEEPGPSRDHTERFLEWLGYPLVRDGLRVSLKAPAPAHAGFSFAVPADFSAASFYIVAATLSPGSEIELDGVNLNPTRTGALDVLREMGADLQVDPAATAGSEPVGKIRVRSAGLHGATVGGDLLTRAIDEVPILAVAAAAATGETLFRDAGELRVKESDRIAAAAEMVRALGAEAETGADWLRIQGVGRLTGGRVLSAGDHRIAMSGLVAGCAAAGPVEVDDVTAVSTSDPTFIDRMVQLGAAFS